MKFTAVVENSTGEVLWTLRKFLSSQAAFRVGSLLDTFDFMRDMVKIPHPFCYISFVGLVSSVRMFLDQGANVNAQCVEHGNALQAASCRGHNKIVQMLLEKSANISAQGVKYDNAPQAASF